MAIYISYYTENTPYENIIQSLIDSIEEIGLSNKIYAVPDRGSWYLNTLYKPEIIKNALTEFDDDIVWIDADNIILKKPELFEQGIDCDFGIHKRTVRGGWSLITSTMYWRKTLASIDLLDMWKDKCEKKECVNESLAVTEPPYKLSTFKPNHHSDQAPLMNAIWEYRQNGNDLNLYDLPKEYVMKYDSPNLNLVDPVIIQNQAGRIFGKTKGSWRYERNLLADKERWKGALKGMSDGTD